MDRRPATGLGRDGAREFDISVAVEAPEELAITEGLTMTERIQIEQHSVAGTLWFAAWLFTIGFLGLGFWKGVLAIVLWPYYLGATFGPMLPGAG